MVAMFLYVCLMNSQSMITVTTQFYDEVLILGSYFYTQLTSDGVKKGVSFITCRNIDVFSKVWIMFPINYISHWSLCVIFNPASVVQADRLTSKVSLPASSCASLVFFCHGKLSGGMWVHAVPSYPFPPPATHLRSFIHPALLHTIVPLSPVLYPCFFCVPLFPHTNVPFF